MRCAPRSIVSIAGDQTDLPAQDHESGRAGALVLGELLALLQRDHRLAQAVDRMRQRVGGAPGVLRGRLLEQFAGECLQIDGCVAHAWTLGRLLFRGAQRTGGGLGARPLRPPEFAAA